MARGHEAQRGPLADDQGIALIGVLWLVALLAVFAAGMLSLLHSAKLTAHSALQEAQAEGLADAAIFLALHELCTARSAMGVAIDGRRAIRSIAGHDAVVSIQDESGKIDINHAPKEIIASLLATAGMSFAQSSSMADAIVAKRSATDQSNGRAVAFRSLKELRSIPGVTSAVFHRIEPALTVYSQSAAVLAATAPKEVLAALPGMDAAKVDTLLVQRRTKPGEVGGSVDVAVGQQSLEGKAFTLMASAQVGTSKFDRRAVVRISGDLRKPFWILEWTSADPDP